MTEERHIKITADSVTLKILTLLLLNKFELEIHPRHISCSEFQLVLWY